MPIIDLLYADEVVVPSSWCYMEERFDGMTLGLLTSGGPVVKRRNVDLMLFMKSKT